MLYLKRKKRFPKKYWQKYRYIKQKGKKPILVVMQQEMDSTARSFLNEENKLKIGPRPEGEDMDTEVGVGDKFKRRKSRKTKIGVIDEDGMIAIN